MKENVIARRYARGLVEYAAEKGELDKVREDIESLADLMDPDRGDISVPELGLFLGSPTVQQDEKIKLTDILCEKMSIGKTVSDFLNILIAKNRISLTGFIAREFERFSQEYETIRNATIETAMPLTESQTATLEKALAETAGCKVRLFAKTNPELIGGLRIQIDDTLMDGSLLNRLERLEAQLT